MRSNEFKPIEAYGVIGNLETCALVGRDGAVDWCCLPYIDSPSVFADILDAEGAGRFAVRPTGSFESEQEYVERTNVLRTTFYTEAGTATVTDFMPIVESGTHEEPQTRGLYRRVTCTDGSVELGVEFAPRFDYDRATTTLGAVDGDVVATGDDRRISLSSPVELTVDEGEAHATTTVTEGETEWFVVGYSMHTPTDPTACERLLEGTIGFWQEWAHSCEEESTCPFDGIAHDAVVRSELVLKLLSYRETGALCAAPTTSLPEVIGGVRNWDYRFSWIRDGARTVRALANLEHDKEARDYVHRFLEFTRAGETAKLRPLYGVERDGGLEEETLDHLTGYRHSAPVRIGNEAAAQQQLDVYGDLVLGIYQRLWDEGEIADADWTAVRRIVEYVRDHWDERDAGIWEIRDGPKHLVHSKVMCWAALDRGIDLAERGGFDAPLDDWRDCRDTIKRTVLEEGYDEELGSFTRSFEGRALDASGLLVAMSGLLPFDDPRVKGTVEAIREELATEEGLVYRYNTSDGLPGEEGAFVFCSFWLVDALVALGRTEEARTVFENVLKYASPLGLLAEEIDPETGRLLGNFPQAFSHIGVINSALYLAETEHDWATVGPPGNPTLIQESSESEQADSA